MSIDTLIKGNKLSEALGYEVHDFDVKTLQEGPQADYLRNLLFAHQLLCIRDQDLEPDDVLAFVRLFGTPDPHLLQKARPDFPEIGILSNIVQGGEPIGSAYVGFAWHTDHAFMAQPSAYTILYAIEVPPEGGDTQFASLYQAYDTLPEADKDFLRPLKGKFSYAKLHAAKTYTGGNVAPMTAEQREKTPEVVHPLVRIHPHTGREGMYINLDDFVGVEGLPDDEMAARIRALFDYTIDNFCYTHKWRPRDLLIWDNRGLIHQATEYDRTAYRRQVYRLTVTGEKPIGWGDIPSRP
jgi:taurine dioxygenase